MTRIFQLNFLLFLAGTCFIGLPGFYLWNESWLNAEITVNPNSTIKVFQHVVFSSLQGFFCFIWLTFWGFFLLCVQILFYHLNHFPSQRLVNIILLLSFCSLFDLLLLDSFYDSGSQYRFMHFDHLLIWDWEKEAWLEFRHKWLCEPFDKQVHEETPF